MPCAGVFLLYQCVNVLGDFLTELFRQDEGLGTNHLPPAQVQCSVVAVGGQAWEEWLKDASKGSGVRCSVRHRLVKHRHEKSLMLKRDTLKWASKVQEGGAKCWLFSLRLYRAHGHELSGGAVVGEPGGEGKILCVLRSGTMSQRMRC